MSVSLDKTRSSIARSKRAASWNRRLRNNDLDALRRQLAIQAYRAAQSA
ncbi:hypothetical protein SEA_SAFTANT_73 [Streptomyces phage Saftant]|uniref:Uncharacterized protein n=2 Tax=Camvirus TaxID=1982879 RepID=A0A2H4PGR0_9CAUD|nr:hypothetical protein KGG95_gp73 [Streptomyces phage Saftant]YP_010056406.1 hypothetical protein KGG97_gp75 [Streptomyces phage Alsaber]WMI33396.1 hypothetical protein SEA_PROVOLONE_76 [Streptomyces phage Provolone]WMI34593.1 hypothetical protein SEA_DEXERS_73 [Streptomyces phage Dexers]ATW61349.1 hypothetical protein SEA_ALSABER_75 [Streptomyces phage Alsaber]QEQ94105.1 hypothetical protein SEA_SAFTANT_73 [Streptomyces phage Saftant]